MNDEQKRVIGGLNLLGIRGRRNDSTGYIEVEDMAVLKRFIRDNPLVFRVTEVDKDWMIVEPAWKPAMNLVPYLKQIEQAQVKLSAQ